MDKLFKALADPRRRELLDLLREKTGQTLWQLCEYLDISRQAVTKHLKVLEEANLVVTIRRGSEKLHFLNPVPIHELSVRWIDKYERRAVRALGVLKIILEEERARQKQMRLEARRRRV